MSTNVLGEVMRTNIIDAMINIVHSGVYSLQESYIRASRATSMGDALDKYVTDSFCGAIGESDEFVRLKNKRGIFLPRERLLLHRMQC